MHPLDGIELWGVDFGKTLSASRDEQYAMLLKFVAIISLLKRRLGVKIEINGLEDLNIVCWKAMVEGMVEE